MFGNNLKAPKAGGQISARQIKELIATVRRAGRGGGVPLDKGHGLQALNTGAGVQLVNNVYVPFWARITAREGPGSDTLASGINDSVTSLTVSSGSGFPTDGPFVIRIDNEYLLVTDVSGTTWTVTRGVFTSTAAAHSTGAAIAWVWRPYRFQQLYQLDEAAWEDDANTRDSSSSSPYIYAYEVNDAAVPVDSVVQLWLERGGASGDYYLFQYRPTSPLVLARPRKLIEEPEEEPLRRRTFVGGCDSVYAQASHSTTQTCSASTTDNVVDLDTDDADPLNEHDTSSNTSRITLAKGGNLIAMAELTATISATPTSSSTIQLKIRKNGSTTLVTKQYRLLDVGGSTGGGTVTAQVWYRDNSFAVDDYLEITVDNEDPSNTLTIAAGCLLGVQRYC